MLWIDLSAVTESKSQAKDLAQHDASTGTQLANLMHLSQALCYALRDAEGNSRKMAVCYVDLDGFKAVNDQFAHDAGVLL